MGVNAYYSETVANFLKDSDERILGVLTREHHHSLEQPQRWAWQQQLTILRSALTRRLTDRLMLEFYIPRMGKRADALLLSENLVFLMEFKIGAGEHLSSAFEQVEDYALDLKNFHEGSHAVPIVPVLVSTGAKPGPPSNACLRRGSSGVALRIKRRRLR